MVDIVELQSCIAMFLGLLPIHPCADPDGNQSVNIVELQASIAAFLGLLSCPSCGDGIVTPPEECDDGNLIDDDGCDSDCTVTTLRFVDHGDGTITDSQTGLMWEKKDEGDGIHDVNNSYTWAGCCDGTCSTSDDYCQPNAAAAAACAVQTGGAIGCEECSLGTCNVDPWGFGAITTIWDWLAQVNTAEFAGYNDWRIPSEEGCNSCWKNWRCSCDPAELETILLEPYPCDTSPCIDSIFGPTASNYYWSSTSRDSGPDSAWLVHFGFGYASGLSKENLRPVRAVRNGEDVR